MLLQPALEGFNTIFSDVTNNIIWQAVANMDCCVDNVWPVETVLDTGTARACHGMDRLERMVLLPA